MRTYSNTNHFVFAGWYAVSQRSFWVPSRLLRCHCAQNPVRSTLILPSTSRTRSKAAEQPTSFVRVQQVRVVKRSYRRIASARLGDGRKAFLNLGDIRRTNLKVFIHVHVRYVSMSWYWSKYTCICSGTNRSPGPEKCISLKSWTRACVCRLSLWTILGRLSIKRILSYSPPWLSTTQFISFCVLKSIKLRSNLAKPPSGSLRLIFQSMKVIVCDVSASQIITVLKTSKRKAVLNGAKVKNQTFLAGSENAPCIHEKHLCSRNNRFFR